ncbi:MAG: CDP-alcohol phosphatidyltransferase family protein [Chlamydiota bacterium]|nr:CDP-alcohol phosphatidyltransferase family protein [Chlamydiota bacterium]
MNTILLVHHSKFDPILNISIAGLLYTERIRHEALKAGFKEVLFISQDAVHKQKLHDLALSISDPCWVLLKAGYLPTISYLKGLCASHQDTGQFVDTNTNAIILYRSENPKNWLSELLLYPDSEKLFNGLQNKFPTQSISIHQGQIYELHSPGQVKEAEDFLFKALIKSTEGFMSRHVERKISIAVSKHLVNSSITPNQMTVFSIFIGLLGAFLITLNQGTWQIAGALFFLAHSILDGCDGEIARIKFLESKFGGVLDYWGDNIVHIAIFSAIAIEWYHRINNSLPLLFGASAVCATLASASWIYWHTMRKKSIHGPLFTSVSQSNKSDKLTQVADFLSRRDFIYLIVVLACIQHLNWFLILSAFGTPIYFAVLLWIHYQTK